MREFTSLSLRDLLDARDAYHVHLSHLENVVATAVGRYLFRDGDWQPDPLILDDQAAVLHVRDKGLVVLTGCGHAGIVNIVRYAQKLTNVERVYAVIGGFHLNGPLFEPIIPATGDAFAELAPEVLVPAHCTGWRAIHALAARLPDAFIQNSVGTRYEL